MFDADHKTLPIKPKTVCAELVEALLCFSALEKQDGPSTGSGQTDFAKDGF
jgi:hypothetical protein